MKTTLILILFLLSSLAFGQGDAPPFTQGQSQTTKSVSSVIQVPHKQVTKRTSSQALIETGNKNRLANPGFEHQTIGTGWSTSFTGDAGMPGGIVAAATAFEGTKSAEVTCVGGVLGGTCTIYQDVTTGFATQALSSIYIKPGVASSVIKVYARKDGANTAFLKDATGFSLTEYNPVSIPIVGGTTSTGIAIEITVGALGSVSVVLDEAFVGYDKVTASASQINYYQSTISTTNVAALSSGSIANTGTASDLYTINAGNITINKSAKIGVTISSSFTTTDLAVSISSTGSILTSCNDRGRGSSVNYYATCSLLIDMVQGDTFTFSSTAGASNLITINATETVKSTVIIGNTQAADRIGEPLFLPTANVPDGFISADNKSIGLTGATYNGTAFKPLYDILWAMAGLSTTAGDPFVISSAKGASADADWAANKRITIDFTSKEVFIRAKGSARNLGSYQASGVPNITGGLGLRMSASVPPTGAIFNSGVNGRGWTTSTDGNDQLKFDASLSSSVYQAITEVRTNNVAMNAFIRYAPRQEIVVMSLKDMVTVSDSSGKPVLCSAKVSAAGVLSEHKGGCFASCTNATTPVCTFTTSYWVNGQTPNCWHSSGDEAGATYLGQSEMSSTSFYGLIRNSSGTAIAGIRRYFCMGERP